MVDARRSFTPVAVTRYPDRPRAPLLGTQNTLTQPIVIESVESVDLAAGPILETADAVAVCDHQLRWGGFRGLRRVRGLVALAAFERGLPAVLVTAFVMDTDSRSIVSTKYSRLIPRRRSPDGERLGAELLSVVWALPELDDSRLVSACRGCPCPHSPGSGRLRGADAPRCGSAVEPASNVSSLATEMLPGTQLSSLRARAVWRDVLSLYRSIPVAEDASRPPLRRLRGRRRGARRV